MGTSGTDHFPSTKTCRECGKDGFIWKHTDSGWRLVDATGRVHMCLRTEAIRRQNISRALRGRNATRSGKKSTWRLGKSPGSYR